MTLLSTHVLDTSAGAPGEGIAVQLLRRAGSEWVAVAGGTTDSDGRIAQLGPKLESGTYMLVFHTGDAGSRFYPEIHVVVALDEQQGHYHLPLLLSPFGYTTYRGS